MQKVVWAQGPTYDMNILEHAYKSYGKSHTLAVLQCARFKNCVWSLAQIYPNRPPAIMPWKIAADR
jgi:hypothetical protein